VSKILSDTAIPNTAMVFAAGFGTRMRPLTENTPKSLIKVNGTPMIDYALNALAAAGVRRAIINTHYLSHQINEHVADRDAPQIHISHEAPEILETGGAIVKALALLGNDPFYVINTDTLWIDNQRPALLRLADMWDPKKMDALLLLSQVDEAIGYEGKGDFNLTNNSVLQRSVNGNQCSFVYSGVMIIKPELFKQCEEKPFSIFKDFLFKDSKYNSENGEMPKLYGLAHDGKWLHVGTPDAIKLAEDAINA
jgi:N-acetyl-alpha-D-muramate 1-phosphate uridylyltransferase